MPCLAGTGARCHNKTNALRQQQQQLADILVQVPPNNCVVACCRVAGGGGCAAWIRFFGDLFSIFSPQRSFFLYYLTCDMCLRFRGCPVVLDIDLSVSARHQKTRVLLCARQLVLLLPRCAAQISKLLAVRVKQNNEFGPQSEHQKTTIFGAPHYCEICLSRDS